MYKYIRDYFEVCVDVGERFTECTYPNIPKGDYPIGNYGTIISRKCNKIKILKQKLNVDGYPIVNLQDVNKQSKQVRVHRLVAWEFCRGYDEKSHKTIVNHIDGVKTNSYYKNLEWTTIKYNNKHAHDMGLNKPHNRNNDEDYIHKICILLEKGLGPNNITKLLHPNMDPKSKEFNNKRSFISRIKNKINYLSISNNYNFK